MGTPALIAYEAPAGAVTALRCHYDGYAAYTGHILAESYDGRAARALTAIGRRISSIKLSPAETRAAELERETRYNPAAKSIDCGEPLRFGSLAEFAEYARRNSDAAAVYVWNARRGGWRYSDRNAVDGGGEPLAPIAKAAKAEHEARMERYFAEQAARDAKHAEYRRRFG